MPGLSRVGELGLSTGKGLLEVKGAVMAGFPKGDHKSVAHCDPLEQALSPELIHTWEIGAFERTSGNRSPAQVTHQSCLAVSAFVCFPSARNALPLFCFTFFSP